MKDFGFPPKQGLYDPALEHDACGVGFVANINASWEDPGDDAANIAWARAFWEDFHPHASGGVYVNFLTDDEAARIPSAYGEELHERLAALKAKHDPDNLVRVNQNSAPAT